MRGVSRFYIEIKSLQKPMAAYSKSFSDNAFKSIALNRIAEAFGNGDSHPNMRAFGLSGFDNDPVSNMPCGLMCDSLELTARTKSRRLGKAIIHALVNCLRPWRRRRLMILRPSEVFILARKPCTDLRQRLLGWYVRFTLLSLVFVYN